MNLVFEGTSSSLAFFEVTSLTFQVTSLNFEITSLALKLPVRLFKLPAEVVLDTGEFTSLICAQRLFEVTSFTFEVTSFRMYKLPVWNLKLPV